MAFPRLLLLLFTFNCALQCVAQDTLVTYKGRVRNLKGKVVHINDRDIYVQSEKQRQLMEKDGVTVNWEKNGNWKPYGKRIDHSGIASIKKADGSEVIIHEFDKLLLTNGKFKQLAGKVIYYDNNDIFYQSDLARKRMTRNIAKRKLEQQELERTEKWQLKQEKLAERALKNEAKQQSRIEKLKKEFEAEVKYKLETLSPIEFEKWKTRELDAIRSAELKRELNRKLRESNTADQLENKEDQILAKFTASKPRNKVFSIIHADDTEEVVYNADTLGYFADGTAEVEYGVAEMRMYIKGRQDGRKHSLHDLGIGAGVGLASSLIMTWTLDAFYGPIPPAISLIVLTVLPPTINPKLQLKGGELQSQAYIDGYERSATGRKAWAFSVGSLAGLSIGTAAALFTAPLLR